MAGLNAHWLNFWQRGQRWYHFWQDYTAYGPASTLNVTLDAATLVSTGAVVWPERLGTLTKTLDAATLSSAGAVSAQSTLVQTLAAATLASNNTVLVGVVLSQTLDAATLSATGVVVSGPEGILSVTLGAVTLISSGTVVWPVRSGNLSSVLEDATPFGSGQIPETATLVQNLGQIVLSSSGIVPVNAAAAPMLENSIVSSTAEILLNVDATLNKILGDVSLETDIYQNFRIEKTIRDINSTPIYLAMGLLFRKDTNILAAQAYSDINGKVTFWVDDDTTQYILVAYKDTPEISGAVVVVGQL